MPNSNLFTHRMLFFLREATSKVYGPRVSSLSYFPSGSIFIRFYFQIYIIKTLKIPRWFFCRYLHLSIYYNFYPVNTTISGTVTRKGLTTPLTRRVASICSLCAGTIYVVFHGSPTGSITLVSSLREMPTVAVMHHPFALGKYRRSSSRIKRNFWHRCRGDIINIYQVPNHKSHLLVIYIICHLPLVFLSPTSQTFAVLFTIFFVHHFLAGSVFECNLIT